MWIRKTHRHGGSLVVGIPAEIVHELKIKDGELLFVGLDGNTFKMMTVKDDEVGDIFKLIKDGKDKAYILRRTKLANKKPG